MAHTNKLRHRPLGILFTAFICSTLQAQSTPHKTIRFTNGQWFDGTHFVRTDFFSIDGVLSKGPSSHLDETVNLNNGYVVPPFGDAHEHNFDSTANTPAVTAQYLKDGIFYAQGMTDVLDGARKVLAASLVDTPTTVDVTYAHGGLTGINGHPKDVYESLAHGYYYPSDDAQRQQVIDSHLRAGQAYWEVDNLSDLDVTWPQILATKPDLIKIFLHETEHYSSDSHAHPPLGGGLDPALVPFIVTRAHAAGLKVAAHVDTAADYHVALLGGVDEFAHLPGYCIQSNEDPTPYRLTDADISLTASLHRTVIPTAAACDSDRLGSKGRAATRTLQLDNLGRLKAAGVNIVIGQDTYGHDSVHEAQYLHDLGLWSNLELLRIWSIATPKDIFPKRRIARLAPGYEASFLVLQADPLKDWTATARIDQRWKQGHRLAP
jgi:cytosine/adenosine deaminase-related metal-dependent hydrolase